MDPEPARVVVVGGACVDVLATSTAVAVPRSSNPGRTLLGSGGVGRNVAENLARLGSRVSLVTAVGRDAFGDRLVAATAAAGVDVSAVVRSAEPTGTWVAVLDADGELLVGVADLAGTEAIGPDDVRRVSRLVDSADLVVLDGNLSPATVASTARLAAETGTPVVLDPVSVPKAERVSAVLAGGLRWLALTPNRDELGALTGLPVGDDDAVAAAVEALHERGVEQVWVRDGATGSLLSVGPDPASRESARLAPVPGPVVDVTGAGDAMLAAYCHALLAGRAPADAAAYAHAAAALTVAVPGSVRPDLTDRLVLDTLATGEVR